MVRNCQSCVYAKQGKGAYVECHRHAPSPQQSSMIVGETLQTFWPRMHYDDWCGEGTPHPGQVVPEKDYLKQK